MPFRNLPDSLTIPPDAGPGDSRIVIGKRLPPPLDTYVFKDESGGNDLDTIGGIFFYKTEFTYEYLVLCAGGNEPGNDRLLLFMGHVASGEIFEVETGRPNGMFWGGNPLTNHFIGILGTGLDIVADQLGNTILRGRNPGDDLDRLHVFGDGTIEWGGGVDPVDTNLYRDSVSTLRTSGDLTVDGDTAIGGSMTADNYASGLVSITPVADTPTSSVVSGLSVAGTTFSGFTNPHSSVIGSQVKGTSSTDLSSSGLTVWIYRTNTTTTTVSWQLVGRP